MAHGKNAWLGCEQNIPFAFRFVYNKRIGKWREAMDIKQAFVAAIERTGNPIAPIILEKAYGATDAVARLMASTADVKVVAEYSDRLMASFSDAELDKIAGTPSFIMALCGLLVASLLQYGRDLAKGA